jgi:hypothetical protein
MLRSLFSIIIGVSIKKSNHLLLSLSVVLALASLLSPGGYMSSVTQIGEFRLQLLCAMRSCNHNGTKGAIHILRVRLMNSAMHPKNHDMPQTFFFQYKY